jgi:hypothetical protein
MGPSAHGREAQRTVHFLLRDLRGNPYDPKDPVGWDLYQVEGGFGGNARVSGDVELWRPTWRVGWMAKAFGSGLGVRLSSGGFCDAGNVFVQCGAHAGARVGLLGTWIKSVATPGPIAPSLRHSMAEAGRPGPPPDPLVPGAPSPSEAPPRRPGMLVEGTPAPYFPLEIYAFASVEGRAVAYNAFLDRDVCDATAGGACAPNPVEKNNFVGDLVLGGAVRIRFIEVAFSRVDRSSEAHAGVLATGAHRFGQVRVTFLY